MYIESVKVYDIIHVNVEVIDKIPLVRNLILLVASHRKQKYFKLLVSIHFLFDNVPYIYDFLDAQNILSKLYRWSYSVIFADHHLANLEA